MAKKSAKQIAWDKLQKRIDQRLRQGYIWKGEDLNYQKLTKRDIEYLKGGVLDYRFEVITSDTDEQLSLTEYKKRQRKRKREDFGYDAPPTDNETVTGHFDIFDTIESLIISIPKVLGSYSRTQGKYVYFEWQSSYPLWSVYKQARERYADNEKALADFYKDNEYILSDCLTIYYKASTQEEIEMCFSKALNLLNKDTITQEDLKMLGKWEETL